MSIPVGQTITKTGCMIRLFGPNNYPHLKAESGNGVMLMLDMLPGDGRHAEVYVDYEALGELRDAIDAWMEDANR